MATLENGWYRGSVPFYEITEINISNTGNGDESWDGSISNDGSIMCYRNGTRVNIVSNTITEIGDSAFFKFLALKEVTGLGSVTAIGERAFCYTPNLEHVDIIPENLTSIGNSAFRMSSVEDTLDLSTVSLDIVGDKATRHKRWSTSSLTAIESVEISKTIYLNVPNSENQKNYPDVPFGIYNGEVITVSDGGCTALSFYHMWNYIYAGTDKQYDTWLEWYNNTINDNGDFAVNNPMTVQVGEEQVAAELGWTYSGRTRVSSEAQLQTILDRLAVGLPTLATIHSANNIDGLHTIVFVGCNYKTHKLAIIDPNVVGTSAIVSWLSFEDIFVEGDDDQDRISIIDFNLPILAPNSTWYKSSTAKGTITEINIVDRYTPTGSEDETWNADAVQAIV